MQCTVYIMWLELWKFGPCMHTTYIKSGVHCQTIVIMILASITAKLLKLASEACTLGSWSYGYPLNAYGAK